MRLEARVAELEVSEQKPSVERESLQRSAVAMRVLGASSDGLLLPLTLLFVAASAVLMRRMFASHS